jgi:hypothetical protein
VWWRQGAHSAGHVAVSVEVKVQRVRENIGQRYVGRFIGLVRKALWVRFQLSIYSMSSFSHFTDSCCDTISMKKSTI